MFQFFSYKHFLLRTLQRCSKIVLLFSCYLQVHDRLRCLSINVDCCEVVVSHYLGVSFVQPLKKKKKEKDSRGMLASYPSY